MRGKRASYCTNSFRFFLGRPHHGPAAVRQRVRCPLQHGSPNRVPNCLLFATQPRIPKPEHFHPTRFEPGIALGVASPSIRMSVLTTVQFNIQERFDAKEIKDVRAKRMLPAKLVSREAPAPQPTPHQFFGPSVVHAQRPRNGSLFRRRHIRTGWLEVSTLRVAHAAFPLTLTLSLGEREPPPPSRRSNAF